MRGREGAGEGERWKEREMEGEREGEGVRWKERAREMEGEREGWKEREGCIVWTEVKRTDLTM